MPLISKIRKYLSNYTSRADYRPDDHPKPNKVSPIVGTRRRSHSSNVWCVYNSHLNTLSTWVPIAVIGPKQL
jgi:hypothetical protein